MTDPQRMRETARRIMEMYGRGEQPTPSDVCELAAWVDATAIPLLKGQRPEDPLPDLSATLLDDATEAPRNSTPMLRPQWLDHPEPGSPKPPPADADDNPPWVAPNSGEQRGEIFNQEVDKALDKRQYEEW